MTEKPTEVIETPDLLGGSGNEVRDPFAIVPLSRLH
jgi:hypothetical protein